MIIGPKYKLARRLGAPIFEKTQTGKFQASKDKKSGRGGKPKSAYGAQLNEKQKARLTYGISEKQFKNYVKKVLAKNTEDPQGLLFDYLERRLDNVVARLGFSRTRREARQSVSHGHIAVNGRRVTIPSYELRKNDKISIRERSIAKGAFGSFDERFKEITIPEWLSMDIKSKEATVIGEPKAKIGELMFDLGSIIEYYRR